MREKEKFKSFKFYIVAADEPIYDPSDFWDLERGEFTTTSTTSMTSSTTTSTTMFSQEFIQGRQIFLKVLKLG